MIKKIFIDNFKSLNDFTIELKPLTVIVGNNAMGKSSILQAVSFLANCTVDDFRIILERRNWSVNNIKSRVGNSNNSTITFETTVQLGDDELRWKMVLQTNVKKNTIHLISESIIDILKDEVLLEYRNTAGGFINDDGELIDIPANFIVSSSCMKIIKGIKNVGYRLKKIADFFENSASFELLSPKDMRLSSRGEVKTIGESGRNLPSFIKQMNNIQKEHFMTKVKKILGERIDDVSASIQGKPGWTQINVKEHYKCKDIEFSSKEISDGILRVLAFVAITEIDASDSVFLMDEIENGINVDYAEPLMKVLSQMYEDSSHQLIVTTHSTVFLDYVGYEQIVFLCRDDNGITRAQYMFENEALKEKLEYMYPGEIILNMSQGEIAEMLLKGSK